MDRGQADGFRAGLDRAVAGFGVEQDQLGEQFPEVLEPGGEPDHSDQVLLPRFPVRIERAQVGAVPALRGQAEHFLRRPPAGLVAAGPQGQDQRFPVVAGGGGHLGDDVLRPEHIEKIAILLPGVVGGESMDTLGGFRPDLRQQRGEAEEGRGIERIRHKADLGDEVLHVRLFEEAHAAGDLEGDARPREFHLQVHGMVMGAVEHGDVPVGAALLEQAADRADDEFGLLARIDGRDEHGFGRIRPDRAQLLAVAPARVPLEDAVGEAQDLRGAAVVRLDLEDGGARMPVGEVHDVVELGAPPGVDALRIVADGHDPVVDADPIDDARLEAVRVLVLVHQDMPELPGAVVGERLVAPEQAQPQLEQVVVVGDLLLPLRLLVGGGEVGDLRPQVGGVGVALGGHFADIAEGVAGVADQAREHAGLRVVLVLQELRIPAPDDVAEERFRIPLVEDVESRLDPHGRAVAAEQALADVVEGASPEKATRHSGQILDPFEHLLRRLVGEGQQKDVSRLDPLPEQPGHPVGQRAGLSRSRSRQHQRRPERGAHRRELLLVQLGGEINFRSRRSVGPVRLFEKIHGARIGEGGPSRKREKPR